VAKKNGKKSAAKVAKEKFFAKGKKLPICVNNGCDNKVVVREWKYWSFKSECSRCTRCRKEGITIPKVTIHKKTFCENNDGHLGFTCPVKVTQWKYFQESLDLDHDDGDHMNNNPNNVKTYCKLCHSRKSKEGGDWNSTKPSARNID